MCFAGNLCYLLEISLLVFFVAILDYVADVVDEMKIPRVLGSDFLEKDAKQRKGRQELTFCCLLLGYLLGQLLALLNASEAS